MAHITLDAGLLAVLKAAGEGNLEPLTQALEQPLAPDVRGILNSLQALLGGGVTAPEAIPPVISPTLALLLEPVSAPLTSALNRVEEMGAMAIFDSLLFNSPGVEISQWLQANPHLHLYGLIQIIKILDHPRMDRPVDTGEETNRIHWERIIDIILSELSYPDKVAFLNYSLRYDPPLPKSKAILEMPRYALSAFTLTEIRGLETTNPPLFEALHQYVKSQEDPIGLFEAIQKELDHLFPKAPSLEACLFEGASLEGFEKSEDFAFYFSLGNLRELSLIAQRNYYSERSEGDLRNMFLRKDVDWTLRYFHFIDDISMKRYGDPVNVSHKNYDLALEHFTPAQIRARSSEMKADYFFNVNFLGRKLSKPLKDYLLGLPLPTDPAEASLLNALINLGTLGEISNLLYRRVSDNKEWVQTNERSEKIVYFVHVLTLSKDELHYSREKMEEIGKLILLCPMEFFDKDYGGWSLRDAVALVKNKIIFPQKLFQTSQGWESNWLKAPLNTLFRFINPPTQEEQSPAERELNEIFKGFSNLTEIIEVLSFLNSYNTLGIIEGDEMVGESYPDPHLLYLMFSIKDKPHSWLKNFIRFLFRAGAPVSELTPWYLPQTSSSNMSRPAMAHLVAFLLTQLSAQELEGLEGDSSASLSLLARNLRDVAVITPELISEILTASSPEEVVRQYKAKIEGYKKAVSFPLPQKDPLNEIAIYVAFKSQQEALKEKVLWVGGEPIDLNSERGRAGYYKESTRLNYPTTQSLKGINNFFSQCIPGSAFSLVIPWDDFFDEDGNPRIPLHDYREVIPKLIIAQTPQVRIELLTQVIKAVENTVEPNPEQLFLIYVLVSSVSTGVLDRMKDAPGSALETIQLFLKYNLPFDIKIWREVRKRNNSEAYIQNLAPKLEGYREGKGVDSSLSDEDLYAAYLAQGISSAVLSFDLFKELVTRNLRTSVPPPFLNEEFSFTVSLSTSVFKEVNAQGLKEALIFLHEVSSEEGVRKVLKEFLETNHKALKTSQNILKDLCKGSIEDLKGERLFEVLTSFLHQLGQLQLFRVPELKEVIEKITVALAWHEHISEEMREKIRIFFQKNGGDKEEVRVKGLGEEYYLRGIGALGEFYNDRLGDVLTQAELPLVFKWNTLKTHGNTLKRIQESMGKEEGDSVEVRAVPSKSPLDAAIGYQTDDCTKKQWELTLTNASIQTYRLISEGTLRGFIYLQEATLDGKKYLVVGIQPYKLWGVKADNLVKAVLAHLTHLASKQNFDGVVLMKAQDRQSNSWDVLNAITNLRFSSIETTDPVSGPIFQGNSFLRVWAKGGPIPDLAPFSPRVSREEIDSAQRAMDGVIAPPLPDDLGNGGERGFIIPEKISVPLAVGHVRLPQSSAPSPIRQESQIEIDDQWYEALKRALTRLEERADLNSPEKRSLRSKLKASLLDLMNNDPEELNAMQQSYEGSYNNPDELISYLAWEILREKWPSQIVQQNNLPVYNYFRPGSASPAAYTPAAAPVGVRVK